MFRHKGLVVDHGNEPAIVADGRRQPDRRQISIRWFVGVCLTGLTSFSLMGMALFTAMEGREQMAIPPDVMVAGEMTFKAAAQGSDRHDRLVMPQLRRTFHDRKQFEVPALQKVGEYDLVRGQTFELVNMALAKEQSQSFDYPAFNALELFEDVPIVENPDSTDMASLFYDARIEAGIVIQMQEFPEEGLIFDETDVLSVNEAERRTREEAIKTGEGVTKIAALAYINPIQIEGLISQSFDFSDIPEVKIVPENVSILAAHRERQPTDAYSEDVIPLIRDEAILDVLNRTSYSSSSFVRLSTVLEQFLGSDHLAPGSILRLGIESNRFDGDMIIRASVYRNRKHVVSVALNDRGRFVRCVEPDMTDMMRATVEGEALVVQTSIEALPTVYDAVFRSALSYGMSVDMAARLVRMLANDIDMQSQISPTDSLEVLYPLDHEAAGKGEEANRHEILYVAANFGNAKRSYYYFRSRDGRAAYYDAQGHNSRQFLLRKPVPNGIFRSPFGPRKHPILGHVRMHTGVDWAAPRGAPIIAAGDGVVVKAGWSRGYGNHTEIRHANGYVTSYSHQSAFANGIAPGVPVHQGQIIGYVGSTGLSSGPHCHFEVIVNGTKVDPMRIRLPDDNSLKEDELVAFMQDRNRIDALLKNGQMAASSVVAMRRFSNGG